MARSFRHLDTNRLQIREGGGCLALFGLPFFAAGVFLLLAVLGLVEIRNADDMPAYSWLLLGILSVAFTLVGGILVFGRSWIVVDTSRRSLLKQWGLLVPMRDQVVPLDGYSAVTLGFVAGDSDSSDAFPIGLKARTGANLSVSSFTTYAESWECAAAVARHLGLDVEDASTDHPVSVTPGQAGTARQWQRDRAHSATVSRPPNMRSVVSHDAGELRIAIPQPRPHPIALAVTFVPVAIVLFVVPSFLDFFRRTQTPTAIGWIFIAFLAIAFGVLPLMTGVNALLRTRRGATIVLVSTHGIRVRERGAWRTRSVAALDAADIVDVDYSTRESAVAKATRVTEQQVLQYGQSATVTMGPRSERLLAAIVRSVKSGGLTVKTGRGLTTFGAGLDDDEIRYLHLLVVRALDGRS